MAGQLNATGRKSSWVRNFFRVEHRLCLDKSTGTENNILSDVCCVILDTGVECGKIYKHVLRNGTKSLQNHLITKHDSVQAVREEIVKHGISRSEVPFNQN